MVTIVEGNHWKDNHDSSLTYDEMRQLILTICTDVPGMSNPPDIMPQEFKFLSLVLRDGKNGVVFLVNGIHQGNELHYNLKCVAAGGDSEFHVYVAQGGKVNVKTKPLASTPRRIKEGTAGKHAVVPLFKYKNTGISWRQHGNAPLLLWPAVFEKNGYAGRERGKSFSIGNSAPIMTRGPNPFTETLI